MPFPLEQFFELQFQKASKASRTLGFIQRNFYHASRNIKEKLYHTLVRPHLEYGVAAWDPYYVKDIETLENVQRRAARFTTGCYSLEASVSQMILSLGVDESPRTQKSPPTDLLVQNYS